MLAEVFAFHMKEGNVLTAPYCQEDNLDAEAKRRKHTPDDEAFAEGLAE